MFKSSAEYFMIISLSISVEIRKIRGDIIAELSVDN